MRLRRLLPLAAAGAAVWYVRSVHRYRDPVRLPAVQADALLSPADGLVCFVRRVTGGKVMVESLDTAVGTGVLLGRPADAAQGGWLMGLFVGPLDVHYTYQPAAGLVSGVAHVGSRQNVALTGAGHLARLLAGHPADLLGTRGALENERLTLVTQTPYGEVSVALVAPAAGLGATSYLRQGDEARAGYKTAFLANGGLVLLHFPESLTPQVSVGERVQGAQTVVARNLAN